MEESKDGRRRAKNGGRKGGIEKCRHGYGGEGRIEERRKGKKRKVRTVKRKEGKEE